MGHRFSQTRPPLIAKHCGQVNTDNYFSLRALRALCDIQSSIPKPSAPCSTSYYLAPCALCLMPLHYGQSVLPKSAAKTARSLPSTSLSPSKSPSQGGPAPQSVRPKSAANVAKSDPSTSLSPSKSPSQG